jgi:uncharacterized protein YbbC (DUF1343 family)
MTLAALFGPEHGIRGESDGPVRDTVDRRTGLPVFSLYGAATRPSLSMLKGLDVLLFDIQDVGARFYTYISTLGHVMEAASERRIPIVVLDRPNPITGVRFGGPVAEDSLLSFVAFAPIPICHGMTIGELARMYNGEKWLARGVEADLQVVPVSGWRRSLWFDETSVPWVPPSPNMLALRTAVVYPGTCLFEGTNLSEGRGTEHPFEVIGAPWLEPDSVIALLSREQNPGVRFSPATFTPVRRPGSPSPPKHEGRLCRGIRIIVTDREIFRPVRAGVAMLRAIRSVHPDSMQWFTHRFDRLAGTPALRRMITLDVPLDSIEASWQAGLDAFAGTRTRYLLYVE